MRFIPLVALLMAVATPVTAQQRGLPPMTTIPAQVDPNAIVLGTGGVPGGASSENWFTFGPGGARSSAIVRNVTQATLTPVLPDPAKATGAAVIVAPGGGFVMLSMDSEGWAPAHWLADHGIAAFVLKYRLKPTPADNMAFGQMLGAELRQTASNPSPTVTTPENAIDDARAALALVRARAAQWGVDRDRVGLLGFSAGAMTVLDLTLQSTPEEMPDFVATLYPLMAKVDVPATAPPLFVALAMDDPLVGGKGYGLVESWHVAQRPVELHQYQSGGHGFGLGRPGTAPAGWISTFYHWLDFNGFLARKAP